MTDPELAAYIESELKKEGLPGILKKIRDRQALLVPAALMPGNTESIKTEISTLGWVLEMIENFSNNIESDTDGDTGG